MASSTGTRTSPRSSSLSDSPTVATIDSSEDKAKSERKASRIPRRFPRRIPLLPKSTSSSASPSQPTKRDLLLSRRRFPPHGPQRRCRVRLCLSESCTLRSHRFYASSQRTNRRPATTTTLDATAKQTSLASDCVTEPDNQRLDLDIIQGGVDGLPALPLDGLEVPAFRELFHQFFSHEYDRLQRLLYPPPFTDAEKQVATQWKRSSLGLAITTPVYCLNYIACAHYQIIQRQHQQNQDSALLVGKMLVLIRAQLNHLEDSNLIYVCLTIFTVVMFELATGHTESLRQHRKAIHHLVETYGGVHKMSRRTAMILSLDRILSLYTSLPPLYTVRLDPSVKRPRTAPLIYGSNLDHPSSPLLFGSEVHQYCLDTCRAIEMVEWEKWTFDPDDPPMRNASNLHYFFFLRDCLACEFLRLHVQTANDQNVPRCVLLTTKIVEYTLLMDNYLMTVPAEMANKLQLIIKTGECKTDLDVNRSLLTWMLFVMASMPSPWQGHSWVLQELRKQLTFKYSSTTWPKDWRRFELDNVRSFVWSDVKFNDQFKYTCDELLRG